MQRCSLMNLGALGAYQKQPVIVATLEAYTVDRASRVQATPASGLGCELHNTFLKLEPESNFTLQTHPASVAGLIDNNGSGSLAAHARPK
ncbi:unnamed protein product [Coregonus sp. 'balchen']|nr:unnamed protein product [Coregonus sp. 'balchen']